MKTKKNSRETEVPKVSTSQAPVPNILVIDDDPIFRRMISVAGRKRNIPVTVCASLRELDPMTNPCRFDVAIIDYYLDGMKERLKGTHIAYVLEGTPVILTSNNEHCISASEPWPQSVRKFINKRDGVDALLDEAMHLKEAAAA